MIMNSGIMGDEEAGWTYMGGREESVIDYTIEGREDKRGDI